MTADDFAILLSKIDERDPFRDLLIFGWHTGCRPQEARHSEPRHVHLPAECIVIPKEEAKGKKRLRIIYLHGPALEIIRRLLSQRPEGKLFRNKQGNPWKKFSLSASFPIARFMLMIGLVDFLVTLRAGLSPTYATFGLTLRTIVG